MVNLFAILTILASLTWLWPATRRWLPAAPDHEAAGLAIGMGVSAGAVSLYMLALGLLPGNLLRPAFVLPLPWLGLAYEAWRCRKSRGARSVSLTLPHLLPNSALYRQLLLIGLGGLVVIAINAISYPFYRYDVLARFAPNARLLFETHTITEALVGYPLEVQLLYSFAFMAGGAVSDHLAGIYVTAFAGALLLTTYAIGRELFSRRAGWVSALLLLSSPLFVDWATSGYVDVPSGVYHGLTFLLAWRWMTSGQQRFALGAGLLAGLALWTKQSAAVLIPALAIVPLLRGWPIHNFWRETRRGLTALAGAVLVAGPWYVRSWLLAGPGGVLIVPGSYDTHRVVASVASLFTFVTDGSLWGPWLGAMVAVGLALWAAHLLWPSLDNASPAHVDRRRRALLLIAFIIPYHLIWWSRFRSVVSDARYLLVSIALYAVIAGHAVDWIAVRLPHLRRVPQWLTLVIAVGLVGYGAFGRMGAVYHLLREPLQSDDAKLARLSPELWDLANEIRRVAPTGSRLYVMDGALAYWLSSDYELQQGYPVRLDDLQGYDFLVTSPVGGAVYAYWGESNNEVVQALGDPVLLREIYHPSGGAAIYQIVARDS